jgi:hypothetical protein
MVDSIFEMRNPVLFMAVASRGGGGGGGGDHTESLLVFYCLNVHHLKWSSLFGICDRFEHICLLHCDAAG